MAASNTDTEKGISAKEESKVAAPKGVGKFKDMVVAKGTAKHPTLAEKEFKVHSSQVAYLISKGYIDEKVKKIA